MKRKALLIGIEEYDSKNFPTLPGVVKETKELKELLSWHEVCGRNYNCDLVLSEGQDVTKMRLRNELISFLNREGVGQGLIYFSGHGLVKAGIGYLCTSDAHPDDPGITFFELQALATSSKIAELVIIIDCCFSGEVFQLISQNESQTTLRKGLAILSGTGAEETSKMESGRSLFTEVIYQGLKGQAADLTGNVTVGSLYRNTEQLLGLTDQRPQFAAFLNQGLVIRKCKSKVDKETGEMLVKLFRGKDTITLSPAHEPTEKLGDVEKEKEFSFLQKMVKAGFVEPVGTEHMYYAAIESKDCRITPSGKYYKELLLKEVI